MPRSHKLPISGRSRPAAHPFLYIDAFFWTIESQKTVKTYRTGLIAFADWLQHHKRGIYSQYASWPMDPAGIEGQHVLDFYEWLRNNRAQSTAVTYAFSVVSFLDFLDEDGKAPNDLDLVVLRRRIKRRSNKAKASKHTSSKQIMELDAERQRLPEIVDYFDELSRKAGKYKEADRLIIFRNRALVHFMISTAARLTEVSDMNRGMIEMTNQPIIRGKFGKHRTIYIDEKARVAIDEYVTLRNDSFEPLFIAHSRNAKGKRLSITSIHNIIKDAVKELGLSNGLSAHDFRHLRASKMLRAGVPLEVVQEYMGHSSIATTRDIYAPLLGVNVVSEWIKKINR